MQGVAGSFAWCCRALQLQGRLQGIAFFVAAHLHGVVCRALQVDPGEKAGRGVDEKLGERAPPTTSRPKALKGWPDKFIARHNTPSKLSSVQARFELLLIALQVKTEITTIECRHAFIRRWVKGRVQARGRRFPDVSSVFTLMRARCLEKASTWTKLTARCSRKRVIQERRRRKSGKFKGGRSGGGGGRRAALSGILKELQAGGIGHTKEELSALWTRAHRLAGAASQEQLDQWAEKGAAGTASWGAGARRSFGRKRKRCSGDRRPRDILHRAVLDATGPRTRAAALAEQTALVQHQTAELQLVNALRAHRAAAGTSADEDVKRRGRLQAWAASRAKEFDHLHVPALSEELGAHAAPALGPKDLHFDYLEWVPPAIALAKRALADRKCVPGKGFGLRLALVDHWKAKHRGIKQSDVPGLDVSPETVSVCSAAGFCLCNPDDETSQNILAFVDALQAVLTKLNGALLRPKAPCRVLYDSAKATGLHQNVRPPEEGFEF